MFIHSIFDLLALAGGGMVSLWFRRHYGLQRPMAVKYSPQYDYYLLFVLLGLVSCSTLFGTLNLHLSGQSGLAKSMLGGVFGAIVSAETFKYFSGIRKSTGMYFVPGLIVLIVVGRIGCFLAGLPDYTYGLKTSLPWGVDFGDGIHRHPVQLYESITMLAFLAALLVSYPRHPAFWQRQGFYVFVLIYAGQRFVWEFIKPYQTVLAGLNLFHWISLALLVYALFMLKRSTPNAT